MTQQAKQKEEKENKLKCMVTNIALKLLESNLLSNNNIYYNNIYYNI